jgi:hypothetical protein
MILKKACPGPEPGEAVSGKVARSERQDPVQPDRILLRSGTRKSAWRFPACIPLEKLESIALMILARFDPKSS